ncbi:hypothetical protein J1614_010625 [Plenodomus biglobosus]|nr:hypothetical protein J1614_010625 [Plenodomus biglobosus]
MKFLVAIQRESIASQLIWDYTNLIVYSLHFFADHDSASTPNSFHAHCLTLSPPRPIARMPIAGAESESPMFSALWLQVDPRRRETDSPMNPRRGSFGTAPRSS